MPWKLIAFLAILLAITFFIGFNLDNRCDVSFVFYKYHDVPIFVSLLAAYVAGAVSVIPFLLGRRSRSAKKGKGRGTTLSGARSDDRLVAGTQTSAGKKRKGAGKLDRERDGERTRPGQSDDYDID